MADPQMSANPGFRANPVPCVENVVEHLRLAPSFWSGATVSLDDLEAIAQGEDSDFVECEMPLGHYFPLLLQKIGWWMVLADLVHAAGDGTITDPASLVELGNLRSSLSRVLGLVPKAWGETLVHSQSGEHHFAGVDLLLRYAQFRKRILDAAALVCPEDVVARMREQA